MWGVVEAMPIPNLNSEVPPSSAIWTDVISKGCALQLTCSRVPSQRGPGALLILRQDAVAPGKHPKTHPILSLTSCTLDRRSKSNVVDYDNNSSILLTSLDRYKDTPSHKSPTTNSFMFAGHIHLDNLPRNRIAMNGSPCKLLKKRRGA